ncbi:MAG TPA: DUF4468 domain-containing protein [Mediterranea massiliensis]|uniref:DUF4468 domain-containing protein n=1 Tax=Mediterranea massiliensis TaxID=1841865 RepID=A0A921HYT6_9BACT|nr:DUF4468 domain-containing protein [Mediterranea massiliensis]HJF92864.1 DUF4468 domain-containing protein [Mediterranea massiliensis]
MKRMTQILFVLFCLCLPAVLQAQKRDDSKYLAGAVPEEDGKVVFSKEFSIPGMSQDEIFERMKKWMELRLKKNQNETSRVVYTNKEKGQIVGMGEEWIVFASSALSLDRTRITYQLSAFCQPEKCEFRIEKIRYTYREGRDQEKYVAEEWITDQYALNKSQTKLVLGLAKWRRKTVDFADALCTEVTEALSAASIDQITVKSDNEDDGKDEEKTESKAIVNAGPTVIEAKKQVVEVPAEAPATAAEVQQQPAAPAPQQTAYKEVAPDQVPADAIQIGAGKLVIVIGTDAFNQTMMTANAGGSLGQMSGKAVIYTFLSPDQAHELLDRAETYTVRFYPNRQQEPTVVLECKKLPSQEPLEGQPRMYIGEIVKAQMK